MLKLIIDANREGYGTDQIRYTMTVGELMDYLGQYDEKTPVYIGNDKQSRGGWYTYGGITEYGISEVDDEDEDEEDEGE